MAVLILGVGIGAVTATFSVVDSILLKPFAFQQPGRLVIVRESPRLGPQPPGPDNYQHYLYWKYNSETLADAAIFRNRGYSASATGEHPEYVDGLEISPNFFSVLGVPPAWGRAFLPSEAVEHNRAVILSWNAWQKYFQGDPSAVGKALRLDGVPHTVVGILPRKFSVPHMSEMSTAPSPGQARAYQIFKPLFPDPNEQGNYNYLVVGRLRDGITLAKAQAELSGLEQAHIRSVAGAGDTWAARGGGLTATAEPLVQEVAGRVSTALWVLLVAICAVLLIGCVNLANLQLARAVSRNREFAVRSALGAGRNSLLWSALAESIVLAALGGMLGLGLTYAGVKAFLAGAPASLPRLGEVHISWPILLGAAALSMSTALLFGLLPAVRLMRIAPQNALQSSARLTGGCEEQRFGRILVATEIACTAALLIVTGLLVRSFWKLWLQPRDFDAGHVILAQVRLDAPQFGDSPEQAATVRAGFITRALTELGQIPGVQSVAMTSELPMAGETWVSLVSRADRPLPPAQAPEVNMRWVSPSYASTLRIPILAGRDLAPADQDHPTNALISQTTARAIWPEQDPVGKTFEVSGESTFTVVGVVGDARINDLKRTANMVYVPYWQNPWWRASFLIRSPQPAAALAESIRKMIWDTDPQVSISVLESMDELVGDSVAPERFQTILLAGFGAAALLLALLGVYGVVAYSVSLRQREFGIRVALGSNQAGLVRFVLRQASAPILGGIAAGLLLAIVATRWIAGILYETRPTDPDVIAVALATLALAGLAAALLPARRAAAVDVMTVLRAE